MEIIKCVDGQLVEYEDDDLNLEEDLTENDRLDAIEANIDLIAELIMELLS